MSLIKCRDTNLNAPSGCKTLTLLVFSMYTHMQKDCKVGMISLHTKHDNKLGQSLDPLP
jgi:hypothetical protein